MAQVRTRSNHYCLLDTRKMGVQDDHMVISATSAISNRERIDHQELCRTPSSLIVSIVSRYRVMLSAFLFQQLQLWLLLAGRPEFTSATGLTLLLSRGH